MMDDALLSRIEKFIDLAAYRQELIVGNMANVDTPHYHTRDIDFASELERARDSLEPSAGPEVREVPGLIARPDGNNVAMDREGLLLAKTQLQFQVGVQFLRHEFQRLLTAIKEGS
jgi:flagellar basal-body rod protein FlgB